MRSSLIGVVKVKDVLEETWVEGFELEEAITCKQSGSNTKLKKIKCLVERKILKLQRENISDWIHFINPLNWNEELQSFIYRCLEDSTTINACE